MIRISAKADILVVEDEKNCAESIQLALAKRGRRDSLPWSINEGTSTMPTDAQDPIFGSRPQTLLIVDDDERNLKLLDSLLQAAGHLTVLATNGREALQRVAEDPPDLILLDVMMPEMDGFEVAARLKREERTRTIPIIMVTGLNDRESRLGALQAGAEDFLTKPVDRAELTVRVRNLLKLKEYSDFLADHNRILEERVRERTLVLTQQREEIQRYVAQLERAFMSTVRVATTLSEMRDPYTAGHERRVAEIAVAMGAELGFDARRQEGLRVAGYLHDIGKITIPAQLLSKPGKLSPIEFQLIQGHPQASYEVLKEVEFPWPVADVALQHHERADGSGYPQGLKGEAILLEARIMAVADVVEAMSSHRPYRPGLGIEAALAEIERGRGSAYDAVVADACLCLFRQKRYELPA